MKSFIALIVLTLTACGTNGTSGDKITGTTTTEGSSITFEKTTPPSRALPDLEGYTVQAESQETCLSWGGSYKCESRFTPQINCSKALVMLRIHDGSTLWWVEQSVELVNGEYLIVRFDSLVRGKLNDYYSVQSQTSVKCED
jgi:hypothetical protein